MKNPRQKARQEINRILDEMIADLHNIKRFALSLDKDAVTAVGKALAHRFNQLTAIYDTLDVITLPPDKKIITPGEKELF